MMVVWGSTKYITILKTRINQMSDQPRIYEVWNGNPKGVPENPDNCVKTVYMANDFIGHQCRNPRGHGKNGEYCARHGKKKGNSK